MIFQTVVIGANDVSSLAEFYAKTLGLKQVSSKSDWNDPVGSIRMALPNFKKSDPEFLLELHIPAPEERLQPEVCYHDGLWNSLSGLFWNF